jgi:hypothetical protein
MSRSIALASTIAGCVYFFVNACLAMPQTSTAEYDVKAVFLYNFAKFVEWPPQAFPSTAPSFTICLNGDPFRGALARTIEGETLDGKPLTVRRITGPGDERGCQILYVAASEAQRSREILAAAASAPILTVGETDNFINDGGIIRFVNVGGRIHFQINPDAAARVSLKVSSRLLRLAEIVRPGQRSGAGQ